MSGGDAQASEIVVLLLGAVVGKGTGVLVMGISMTVLAANKGLALNAAGDGADGSTNKGFVLLSVIAEDRDVFVDDSNAGEVMDGRGPVGGAGAGGGMCDRGGGMPISAVPGGDG